MVPPHLEWEGGSLPAHPDWEGGQGPWEGEVGPPPPPKLVSNSKIRIEVGNQVVLSNIINNGFI